MKYIATLDPNGGKNNNSIHWIDWEVNEPYMNLLFIERNLLQSY